MLHLQLRSCYKFYMGHKTKKNYLGVLNYEKTPLIIHCHCNWIHTLFTSIDFLSNSNILSFPAASSLRQSSANESRSGNC